MQGQPRSSEIQQLTDTPLPTGGTDVPQLVGGRYRVLAPRGSGAEASVYLAVDLFTDKEVARALGYLHRLGIVHGDVKPQNAVLAGRLAGRRALLVDLGLAGVQPAARGSLEYAAPEVLEGAAPDAASDLYSLGVMLHELVSGVNPFAARTPAEVIRGHFESVPPARASAGVQAVVAELVAREVRSRYAQTDEVIEALAAATGLVLDSEGEGLAPDRIGLGQLYGREAELERIEEAA